MLFEALFKEKCFWVCIFLLSNYCTCGVFGNPIKLLLFLKGINKPSNSLFHYFLLISIRETFFCNATDFTNTQVQVNLSFTKFILQF